MTRVARVVVGAMLLACVLGARDLAMPATTAACSCRAPDPATIRDMAQGPNAVLFAGTVLSMDRGTDQMGHTTGVIEITAVYKGSLPANRLPVVGGGGGDCTMSLSPGQRLIGMGSFDGRSLTPGLCGYLGDPTTPEGQKWVQAAVAAFGPGSGPPGTGDTGPPANPGPVGQDVAMPLVLGLVLLVVVVMFGAIALGTRRGRDAT